VNKEIVTFRVWFHGTMTGFFYAKIKYDEGCAEGEGASLNWKILMEMEMVKTKNSWVFS